MGRIESQLLSKVLRALTTPALPRLTRASGVTAAAKAIAPQARTEMTAKKRILKERTVKRKAGVKRVESRRGELRLRIPTRTRSSFYRLAVQPSRLDIDLLVATGPVIGLLGSGCRGREIGCQPISSSVSVLKEELAAFRWTSHRCELNTTKREARRVSESSVPGKHTTNSNLWTYRSRTSPRDLNHDQKALSREGLITGHLCGLYPAKSNHGQVSFHTATAHGK